MVDILFLAIVLVTPQKNLEKPTHVYQKMNIITKSDSKYGQVYTLLNV